MSAASAVPAQGALPVVFYDGSCGMCHRTVRFLIDEDPEGRLFRFAPIGGETFLSRIDEATRRGLPDSVAVLEPDGRLATRSDAVIRLLDALGGRHTRRARLLRALPRPLRDLLYDGVAVVRRRLWAPPQDACPVVAPELRARFDP